MRRIAVLSLAVGLLAAWPGHAVAQTGPPTAQPQAASAAAAQPGPRGRVDVATDKGYARLLFTFSRAATVSASIADGVLTIRLAAPVNLDMTALTDKLQGYISNGRSDADGLSYHFSIARPLGLHTSSQPDKTAVDLLPDGFKGVPPDLEPPPPPPPKPPAPEVGSLPSLKVRVAEYANFTRLVFDWPKSVDYMVYPGRGRATVRFDALARPDFSMLTQRSPAWVKNVGWHIDGMTTVVEIETDAESEFHDMRDGPRIAIDVLAPNTDAGAVAAAIPIPPPPAPQPGAKGPAPKGSDAAAVLNGMKVPAPKPRPERKTARQPSPPPAPAQMRPPSAEITRDGSVIHFPQGKGHAVAVFARGDTTWIVLDNHPAIDAASLIAPLTNVARAEASQVQGMTVLRLAFKMAQIPSVSESDVSLDLALTNAGTSPSSAINLTRAGSDGQIVLTTPLPGATRVITLSDPDAGDRILAIPARPGRSMLTPKTFVELETLPSATGLAVIPFADDLAVNVQDETVTFSRPQGLALSSSSGANVEPIVQMQQSKEGPAYIDFAQWGRSPGDTIYESERILRAAVARVPENESARARLQLARYLLAHDLAPEALGEIGILQGSDPALANDPGLTTMKGAAQMMMGRNADAKASLSSEWLTGDPNAALWRGIAETKLGDYGNARRDLLLALPVLPTYPKSWQTRARLARAETGLAQGDLASAADALDQLPTELEPRDLLEARLYQAELMAVQGHANEAVAKLRGLEQSDYLPVSARATYSRVDTLLNVKKIKPEDAINDLENLRFRWRGDSLELKTLRKLGGLYFVANRWREGLTTLRIAALNFPNADLARDAQDDMRKAFVDLFLGGKADAMQPVQALGLFYDFTELTPIGRDGDEMIRKLSDRLVTVDLLGPAEQLLDHQVNQRLDGVARAAVATKLAVIYLLDHKPNDALKILNATRQTRLPDEISEQRRILEARALAGVKRYDAAIDLIADDENPDAKRLRADIYWDLTNWKMAGEKLEELLGERWNAEGELSAAERDMVMRAAVAYSLGSDNGSLETLRSRYAAKMSASPDAKAFAVVTERIDQQGVAFRDLAKQIATVDALQAFMDDFKKRGAATAAPQTASN